MYSTSRLLFSLFVIFFPTISLASPTFIKCKYTELLTKNSKSDYVYDYRYKLIYKKKYDKLYEHNGTDYFVIHNNLLIKAKRYQSFLLQNKTKKKLIEYSINNMPNADIRAFSRNYIEIIVYPNNRMFLDGHTGFTPKSHRTVIKIDRITGSYLLYDSVDSDYTIRRGDCEKIKNKPIF